LVDKEEEKKQLDEEAKAALTYINSTHVFNRAELLALLGFKARLDEKTPDDRLMVGMVGYPNVGKSSVINVLCGRKRVGVASMPGKTKHF
jgi:large subunit GTPase 1